MICFLITIMRSETSQPDLQIKVNNATRCSSLPPPII